MTATLEQDTTAITLSANAARRIRTILSDETTPSALRISVEGGGCSGFSYKFDIVTNEPEADDLVLERDGATVLVDSLSQTFMGGSEIDFVDDLIGQSFKIRNPNAVASCGCGTSFSV